METLVLAIENYQLLEKVKFEFIQGLNLIVGDSNSSKSSVLRAFETLIFNLAREKHITFTKPYMQIGIRYNGHEVIYRREPDKSPPVLYSVDKELYQKVGRTPLPQVTDTLNIHEIIVDGVPYRVNISKQMSAPFLTDKTPSQLFKFFISTEKDNLTAVLSSMKDDLVQMKQEFNNTEVLRNEKQKELLNIEKNIFDILLGYTQSRHLLLQEMSQQIIQKLNQPLVNNKNTAVQEEDALSLIRGALQYGSNQDYSGWREHRGVCIRFSNSLCERIQLVIGSLSRLDFLEKTQTQIHNTNININNINNIINDINNINTNTTSTPTPESISEEINNVFVSYECISNLISQIMLIKERISYLAKRISNLLSIRDQISKCISVELTTEKDLSDYLTLTNRIGEKQALLSRLPTALQINTSDEDSPIQQATLLLSLLESHLIRLPDISLEDIKAPDTEVFLSYFNCPYCNKPL